jgi:hypothetical protein
MQRPSSISDGTGGWPSPNGPDLPAFADVTMNGVECARPKLRPCGREPLLGVGQPDRDPIGRPAFAVVLPLHQFRDQPFGVRLPLAAGLPAPPLPSSSRVALSKITA